MKKNYEQPIIEIITLNEEDIITTSGGLIWSDTGDGGLDDFTNLFK